MVYAEKCVHVRKFDVEIIINILSGDMLHFR